MPRTVVEVSPGPSLPTTFSALISQPSKPTPSVMPPVALVEIETAAELIPGPRGSMWFTGSGAPSSLPGQQLGDMYLDNSNDHIWQLLGGGWVDTGTVIHGSPDTPADILAKLVTVDGPGSLLDADTLDGRDSLYFATDADLDAETLNRSNADANLQTQINGKLDPATAASTYVDIAGDTMTGKLNTAASAAGAAGLNLPHGAAPSAPVNGDIWTTTTNLSWRQNGATYNAMNLNGSQTVTGVKTFTAEPIMPTPAAGGASIRLPHGAAPSAPVDGDFWTTTAGIYARLNGATINLANTFPEAPTDGQQYVRQSASWQPVDVPPGTIMQDNPPSSPDPGQLWYETDTGALYLWLIDAGGGGGQWVQVNGPLVAADVVPITAAYLEWSGANLSLRREGGTRLWINGRNETIPVAGVTLAATGLTMTGGIAASAIYYIYAAMIAGVMTLEASPTVWVVDATSGLRVKTGDASRTLVGLAGLASAGNWWTGNNCGVCSWYNPRWRRVQTSIASQAFTGALTASSCYHYFAAFGDRPMICTAYCRGASHTAAAQDHSMDLRIGPSQTAVWTSVLSGNAGTLTARLSAAASNASQFFSMTIPLDKTFSPTIDGQYLQQIYCATSSATGTFYGLTVDTMTWG